MAIQIRRGASEDFDASKMVSGELGVATDGSHKMWATGQAGDSWELASKEDLDDEVEARETLAETVEAQGESLEGKADIDGMYDDLYAGGLTTDKKQTDSVPYLFRKTGGTLSGIAERCYETIIGASVGENQLVQNGDFASADGWIAYSGTVAVSSGKLTFTATEQNNYAYVGRNDLANSIINHIYLSSAYITMSEASTKVAFSGGGVYSDKYFSVSANARTKCEKVFKATSEGTVFYIYPMREGSGIAVGSTMIIEKVQNIDLTAYFGSSIADYIYSLESATAGAGIAKLREWGFLRGYQEFNSGSLESVEVTGKKVVGFNAWDEVWEPGAIVDGEDTSANAIRSKNYIPVVPSVTYYAKSAGQYIYISEYDADKNFISPRYSRQDATFTPSVNTRYIRFNMAGAYGTTYHNDICINLSSDRNGEYEAYVAQSYDYGNDTLRGIFKLDANNQLYADGDRKTSDGTITRHYGTRAYQSGDESLPDAITDGTTTVYKLATPTTETSTPFQSPQVCYPDGAEEYVTGNGVPVGHETEYPYDLKGLVEGLIDVPDVPSTNGTYVLKATRSASGITYTWVADSAVSLALTSPLMSAPPQTTTDESEESEESEEEGETTR